MRSTCAEPARQGRIENRVAGPLDGWSPDQRVALATGQICRVVDGRSAFVIVSNPKVRVERGALGAFCLVVEGLKMTPQVR